MIVRGPLQKGLLTGKFNGGTLFPDGDIRHDWTGGEWFQSNIDKVQRLRPLGENERTMAQLGLRYVLSHPAVSAAIPGAKTMQQVEDNASGPVRPLMSDDELRVIKEVAPMSV
ncbi:MAG: aldo/keto reductase [Chloroflexota bacterium]|nr:aldo/keto reductase [Chloroflexota bacterium]